MSLTIKINGTRYHVELKEPHCGHLHYHDAPHADGSPGQPAHHHHDAKCEWIPALLKPVRPKIKSTVHRLDG